MAWLILNLSMVAANAAFFIYGQYWWSAVGTLAALWATWRSWMEWA